MKKTKKSLDDGDNKWKNNRWEGKVTKLLRGVFLYQVNYIKNLEILLRYPPLTQVKFLLALKAEQRKLLFGDYPKNVWGYKDVGAEKAIYKKLIYKWLIVEGYISYRDSLFKGYLFISENLKNNIHDLLCKKLKMLNKEQRVEYFKKYIELTGHEDLFIVSKMVEHLILLDYFYGLYEGPKDPSDLSPKSPPWGGDSNDSDDSDDFDDFDDFDDSDIEAGNLLERPSRNRHLENIRRSLGRMIREEKAKDKEGSLPRKYLKSNECIELNYIKTFDTNVNVLKLTQLLRQINKEARLDLLRQFTPEEQAVILTLFYPSEKKKLFPDWPLPEGSKLADFIDPDNFVRFQQYCSALNIQSGKSCVLYPYFEDVKKDDELSEKVESFAVLLALEHLIYHPKERSIILFKINESLVTKDLIEREFNSSISPTPSKSKVYLDLDSNGILNDQGELDYKVIKNIKNLLDSYILS